MSGFDLNHALFLDGVFIPGPGSDGSLVPPPPPPYATGAVQFDGTVDLELLSLTATNSPFLLVSYWYKLTSAGWGPGVAWVADPSASNDLLDYGVTGPDFQIRDPSDRLANRISFGDANIETTEAWHHVLMAVDVNHAAGARPHAVFIDDVDATQSDTDYSELGVAFSLLPNGKGFAIGGDTFGSFVVAALADFWWGCAQYLDIGITANRRKFITSTIKPVDLGTDGSTPTGTAPTIFLRRVPAVGTAADFATDKSGNANTFTVTGGTLSDATTSPSD